MLDFLDGEGTVRKGRLATVGYCMAGTFADRVAVSASFYGARLITDLPDSAHLVAPRITGEMYFGCAEHDSYVPAGTLEQLQRIIDEAGMNGWIEVYPEAQHGFAFPTRRLHHKASSERHWERLFDMFGRDL